MKGLDGTVIADAIARQVVDRLEVEGALPLPERRWDAIVDDPDMTKKHEFRQIGAISARAAQAEAYRRACRNEGFRLWTAMPAGDESVVEHGVREFAYLYTTVHQAFGHPDIDYGSPSRVEPAEVT